MGNVRLSYAKNTTTNQIDVLDRNDYYPFGMNFVGNNSVFDAQGSGLNYKYNGKELQESGMYDYGARMYMPDLGRWFTVDPLAETSRRWSTYAYAYNNPIMFIDPDGMQNEGWISQLIDGKQTVTYDPNVNTNQEADDSGKYEHRSGDVSITSAINITNPTTGAESLLYSLNADSSVTDASGGSVGGDFTTDGGIAVNGVTGSGWFSGLSNFFTNNGSDTFSISPGGTNTNVGYSGFRPGKDNTADAGGFFGGMLNGLGGKFDIKMPRFESILGVVNTTLGLLGINPPGGTKSDSVTISDKYYKSNGVLTDTISTVPRVDSARSRNGIDSVSTVNATKWLKDVKWIK